MGLFSDLERLSRLAQRERARREHERFRAGADRAAREIEKEAEKELESLRDRAQQSRARGRNNEADRLDHEVLIKELGLSQFQARQFMGDK